MSTLSISASHPARREQKTKSSHFIIAMIVDPLDKSLSVKTECEELRAQRSCSHANRDSAAQGSGAFIVIKTEGVETR